MHDQMKADRILSSFEMQDCEGIQFEEKDGWLLASKSVPYPVAIKTDKFMRDVLKINTHSSDIAMWAAEGPNYRLKVRL